MSDEQDGFDCPVENPGERIALIQAELAAREREALEAIKGDICNWLSGTLNISINTDSFLDTLDTGVAVCKLATLIQQAAKEIEMKGRTPHCRVPLSPLSCNLRAKKGTFFARDNTSNFITWCRKLGVEETVIFESEGLVLHKDEKRVILCLLDVARFADRVGISPPELVRMEKEIDELEAREMDSSPSSPHTTTNDGKLQKLSLVSPQMERSSIGLTQLLERSPSPDVSPSYSPSPPPPGMLKAPSPPRVPSPPEPHPTPREVAMVTSTADSGESQPPPVDAGTETSAQTQSPPRVFTTQPSLAVEEKPVAERMGQTPSPQLPSSSPVATSQLASSSPRSTPTEEHPSETPSPIHTTSPEKVNQQPNPHPVPLSPIATSQPIALSSTATTHSTPSSPIATSQPAPRSPVSKIQTSTKIPSPIRTLSPERMDQQPTPSSPTAITHPPLSPPKSPVFKSRPSKIPSPVHTTSKPRSRQPTATPPNTKKTATKQRSLSPIATRVQRSKRQREEEQGGERASKKQRNNGAESEATERKQESVDEKVMRRVNECTCSKKFEVKSCGNGKFIVQGASGRKMTVYARLLSDRVMVRVGGGWDSLDHFLLKHDPCRIHAITLAGKATKAARALSPQEFLRASTQQEV